MRCHHQEVHVIDDGIDRQILAVIVLGLTELGENILPIAGPPHWHHRRKIADEEIAPRHPAPHRRARQRTAHHPDARLHHIDKRLIDLLGIRSPRQTEKAGRGEIERQLLDLGIEQQIALPRRQLCGNACVQRIGIELHRFGFERHRQRLPVSAMLLEVHQHQPAREQEVEYRTPALFGAENLVAIEQHQLVRLWPDQRHRSATERLVTIDRAIFGNHRTAERNRIAEHFERVADQRPTILARNMIERGRRSARQPMRVGFGRMGERGHIISRGQPLVPRPFTDSKVNSWRAASQLFCARTK